MIIETDKSTKMAALTTVMVNDFGDSYHRLDNEPSSELEKEVRRIRRRYRSFEDYKKAKRVYIEYMDKLSEKYGGEKQFQMRLDSGTIFDYIPPLPKLKKSPINNFIVKNNIVISDPSRVSYNSEKLQEYEEKFSEELQSDTEISGDIIKVKDKKLRKMAEESVMSVKRLKGMNETEAVDLLASFFDSTNTKKGKKKKNKFREQDYPSITDILDDKYDPDKEDDDDIVFFRGRHMTAGELKEMQFYQTLNSLGWNSLALMKYHNSASSSAISDVLKTDKAEKKNKKGKKNKGKKAADSFLVKMMGDNDDTSFEDFEVDMLDFTVNNVFR